MISTNSMLRSTRPIRREAATHLYAVGQIVRLKGRLGSFPTAAEIYHITAMLPPSGGSLQYRVRNDEERYERVTTQDNIEPVQASPHGETATLLERTFGHGQGTKA